MNRLRHFLSSLKKHHFYLGGVLFLIASLATTWWITQAKPSKILNQAFAASCFWEGPGITAAYDEENGDLNIISKESYWTYNGSSWTVNAQPFSKKISPLPGKGEAGRLPWEGPGITAAYYGGGNNLNIISQQYYWIYDGSSWTTNGKHLKDRFSPGPSSGKAGRLPWQGPGVTAAFYGSGGNLNIISQDYYWIKKDNIWTVNGEPLSQRWSPQPGKGEAGRLPWEGPGITAAYKKPDDNIIIISQDFYWEKSGSSWPVSGKRVSGLTSIAPSCGSSPQSPTPTPAGPTPTPTPPPPISDKPNIIFIVSDDQPPQTLNIKGLADNPWIDNQSERASYPSRINTPNLQKLADSGIYFNKMYVPTGQCEPSRSSIFSSKMPHSHGVVTNGIQFNLNQPILPKILKNNGYYTAIVGKCHLGGEPYYDEDDNSGDKIPINPDPFVSRLGFDDRWVMHPDNGGARDWYNYQISHNGQVISVDKQAYKNKYGKNQGLTLAYHTNYITDIAIDIINAPASQRDNKPFFLWLSYFSPHEPYDANTLPPETKIGGYRYSLNQLFSPPSINDNLKNKPPQQTNSLPHQRFLKQGNDRVKDQYRIVYEMVTNIDSNVGKVLDALDKKGLTDNTIIIFVSDNGVFFGEHQMFKKGPTVYEEMVRMPLIISYPKLTASASNRTNQSLISSIDIMPTLLDILGIRAPSDSQGQSFLNSLANGSQKQRDSVMLEYAQMHGIDYPIRAVVSADGFKFSHYLASTVRPVRNTDKQTIQTVKYDAFNYEFYNLNTDPFETNNLLKRLNPGDNPLDRMLNDPQYGNQIKRLRRELARWQTDTQDPNQILLKSLIVNTPDNGIIHIEWQTDTNATTEVSYRQKDCSSCQDQEVSNLNYSLKHSVNLTNLTLDVPYIIDIYSITNSGNGGHKQLEAMPQSRTP